MKGRAVPSVTQVLSGVGIIDPDFYTNPEKRDFGTRIHKVTAGDDPLDEFEAAYLEIWEQALKNHPAYGNVWGKPSVAEVSLVDPVLWYAGTFDRLFKISDGCHMLVDLKTGSPDKWHQVQVPAYGNLIRANYSLPVQMWVLYINLERFKWEKVRNDPKNLNLFISALNVYRFNPKPEVEQ